MARSQRYPHEPDYAVPPGRTLQDTIAALDMDQRELAVRTGLDKKTINHIIKGSHPLSQQTAIKLERATGVPARLWNNLEMQYQERLARLRDRERLEGELDWLREMPTRELVRRGFVEETRDKVNLLRQTLSFFGVSSTAEWNTLWRECLACRFRRSRAFEMRPGPTAVWLRLGEIHGLAADCRPFEKERFLEALGHARSLTARNPEVWQTQLVDLCSQAGVAVVFVPEIRGCPASGVTRWLASNKALIQLSLRYKADDHFWFTFFHEAGHILHDPKKAIFIEDGSADVEAEDRANRFATNFLIPPQHQTELQAMRSKEQVEGFAVKVGISPGIVVGQMQKKGIIPYAHLNGLKVKLLWAEN